MSLSGTSTWLGRPAGDRSGRAIAVGAGLVALVCAAAILSIASGPAGFIPGRALSVMFGMTDTGSPEFARDALVVVDIRLPRTILAALVGAALGVSGLVMQGLFRNPLADPGIVGVSAGAAMAAVATIVIGGPWLGALWPPLAVYALPVAAFAGGLAVTVALYVIATRDGRTSVATMLLAGIAIGALAGAMTGALVFVSDDRELRDFTFWSLGSLAGATWEKTTVAAVLLLVVAAFAPGLSRGLDALLLGEEEARHLGVAIEKFKRRAAFAVAASVGMAVAVAGPIGFVGIVVPHLLRLAIGPRHAGLLPCCALGGAVLLVAADMAARSVVAPAELPVGIVTALIGAPFSLWLLLRQRALVDL